MRAVIIAGGNVGEYIKNYVLPEDFVICADSGYDHARRYGIVPDVVIGDMDSVKGEYPENSIVYPVRKDFTDSELAVSYALDNGYKKILMFGITGTRMDHTLSGISLLLRAKNGVIIDEHNEIYLAEGEFSLNGEVGDIVSVVPVFGDIFGVTTKGLEYELENGAVKSGTGLGVSNVMKDKTCKIKIEKGICLVIRSKD